MSDAKISSLPAASSVGDADLIPIVQGGVTKKAVKSLLGGSFLSANTARVDLSGDDSTGTVGDLTKPYLTVQAAIDDLQTTAGIGAKALIYVGIGITPEDLTCSLGQLTVVGLGGGNNQQFNSITLTDSFQTLALIDVNAGNVFASLGNLFVQLLDSEVGDLTNTGGAIFVSSDAGQSTVNGSIQAAGRILAYNLDSIVGTITSSTGAEIRLTCISTTGSSGTSYTNLATIDSPGSDVYLFDALVDTVTACATLHLIDSRVQGTNNATSTVYEDVLLRATKVTDSAATSGTVNATGHPLETINLTSGSTIVSLTVDIGLCPNQGVVRLHSKSIVTALTVAATGGSFEDAALTTLAAGGNAAWQNDNGVFIRIQ